MNDALVALTEDTDGGNISDRLLRAALTAARVGLWDFDVQSQRVYASDLVRQLYAFGEREELTFDAFTARIHPDDLPLVQASVSASLSGASERYEVEHRVLRTDGSFCWVEVRGNVLRDAAGTPTRMVGTMVDATLRKQAEQERAAHEQLLGQLIAHTPAAVAMFDTQMRYLATSQRWISDYHLEGVPLIGRSHYEVFPEVSEAWRQIHQRVLAGAVERCDEDPFPRSDGTLEWLQWEVQPWRDASGAIAGLIMFTQLITERKRAQEALAKAEEKFARVFRSAPVAIAITRVSDGLILDVNAEFEHLFGHARKDAVGRTTVELGMWPDSAQRERLSQWSKSVDEIPAGFEISLRTKDGRTLPFSTSAHRLLHDGELYVLTAFQDLSERKRSEAEIRARESRLRRLFSSSILGIAFLASDGRLTEANDECLRLLGVSAQEVAQGAVNLVAMVAPEYQHGVANALKGKRDLSRKGLEVELVGAGGARVPAGLGVSLLDESSGEQVAFIFDLSARRKLEQQLAQAQRMEAVGRLSAGIAHDFNNVLAAINMSTELLQESLPSQHPGREDLREVRKASDRAIRLVRQLLAFSRQQVLTPRVIGLNELVQNLENMLRRLLGDDIQMQLALAPDLFPVKADPSQIEQVIVNLVVNARDAMPDGGQLTIRSENVVLEAEREFDVRLSAGCYAVLSVRDTGTGMDAITKARMFEPFFTTKEQGKGTGLGLSTVYGVVRQSGGAIEVTSAPQQGTTLRIYLPCAAEAAVSSISPVKAEPVGGHETILMVEDDPAVRRTTRKLLVSLGYRVLDSESAESALSLARVYVGGIDLLLVDMKLPSRSGRDVARELSALRPNARVLYMSGYAGDLARGDGPLDAMSFIQKPFTGEALARKLRELLDIPAPA